VKMFNEANWLLPPGNVEASRTENYIEAKEDRLLQAREEVTLIYVARNSLKRGEKKRESNG